MSSLGFHHEGRQVVIDCCSPLRKKITHSTGAVESTDCEVVALFEARVTKTCPVGGEGLCVLVGLEDGSVYFLRARIHEKSFSVILSNRGTTTDEGMDVVANKRPESLWDLDEVVEGLNLGAKEESVSSRIVVVEDCYLLHVNDDAKAVTFLSYCALGEGSDALAICSSSAGGGSVVIIASIKPLLCATNSNNTSQEYVKNVSRATASPFPGNPHPRHVVIGCPGIEGMQHDIGVITALASIPPSAGGSENCPILLAGSEDGRVYSLTVPTLDHSSTCSSPLVARALVGGCDSVRGSITRLAVSHTSSSSSPSSDGPTSVVRVHFDVEARTLGVGRAEQLAMDCAAILLEGGAVELLPLSSPTIVGDSLCSLPKEPVPPVSTTAAAVSIQEAQDYVALFEECLKGEENARRSLHALSTELRRAVYLLKFVQGVRGGSIGITFDEQNLRKESTPYALLVSLVTDRARGLLRITLSSDNKNVVEALQTRPLLIHVVPTIAAGACAALTIIGDLESESTTAPLHTESFCRPLCFASVPEARAIVEVPYIRGSGEQMVELFLGTAGVPLSEHLKANHSGMPHFPSMASAPLFLGRSTCLEEGVRGSSSPLRYSIAAQRAADTTSAISAQASGAIQPLEPWEHLGGSYQHSDMYCMPVPLQRAALLTARLAHDLQPETSSPEARTEGRSLDIRSAGSTEDTSLSPLDGGASSMQRTIEDLWTAYEALVAKGFTE